MTAVLGGMSVTLRPFREEEAELVWSTYLSGNDGFLPHPEPPSRQEIADRVRDSGSLRRGMLDLAIEADGRLVGHVQARRPEGYLPPGVFELGIVIYDREDRGRGRGTEALRLIADHAFGDLGAHRVQLTTDISNTAMIGAAERAGFFREGVLRAFARTVEGTRDYALFAITKEDRWT